VRCTRAAHDDGKDVDLGTWRVATDGIGEGGFLSRMRWAVWDRF
jgi:hypothetical protein